MSNIITCDYCTCLLSNSEYGSNYNQIHTPNGIKNYCTFCMDNVIFHNCELNIEVDMNIFQDIEHKEWFYFDSTGDKDPIRIYYCPLCGKKL